jgi:N-acetylglucosaminyldiphosphoundecaprenol N-acetyl-beta-D-mannosaminyltransferase
VTGYELFKWFLTYANDNKCSIFLLGGRSRTLDRMAAVISRAYRNIRIVGRHHGYFDSVREKEIAESIRKTRPDFLFVGMGAFRQETFIYNWREEINVPVMIGVGGSFDAFTGKAPRVPRWIARLGLEWFVRFIMDPRRIVRVWKLPLFVLEMVWYRIFQAKVV